jgi:uncharacterized RDD family membrane protein YckC
VKGPEIGPGNHQQAGVRKMPTPATSSNLSSKTDPVSGSVALASRLDRFFASLIDGVIMMVVAFPVAFVLSFILPNSMFVSMIVMVLAAMGIFLAVNYKLLRDNGQTIGKRIMNIKIVGRDDKQMPVNDILLKRYAPLWVVSLIPYLGGLLLLANVLCIFRDSQACLHDDIAQTKVVAA